MNKINGGTSQNIDKINGGTSKNMNKIKTSLLLLITLAMSIYMVNAQPGSVTNLKNITYADSYINWTWKDPGNSNFSHVMIYVNGQYETNVTKGIRYYNATDLNANTSYKISTRTVDTNGSVNSTLVNHTARTAAEIVDVDIIPPYSIKNLKNITYARRYINWTWNDPSDSDFAKVMIYINGHFERNVTKGVEYYNATNLTANTSYKISTHTVDDSGNINHTWVNRSARTATLDTIPPKSITNLRNITYAYSNINWTWQDPDNADLSHIMVYINGQFERNVTKDVEYYNATDLNPGSRYTISTHTVDDSGNVNQTWVNHTANTSYRGPIITIINEPDNLNITVGGSLYFNIKVDQRVNVTWKSNNDTVKSETILANKTSNYTFKPTDKGNYNLKVTVVNDNGTDSKNWQITVHPKTYTIGNRIWDGSKPNEYSLTYTWNPMSFSGFYYNLDSNVGSESLTMTLDNYQDRSINEEKLIYSAIPQEVWFDYSDFGRYQVIGFMADRYFAGYTDNTTPPHSKEEVKKISAIGQGQLHKVLLNDDIKRTLAVGSTITLREGYVIKAKDIGDRTMLISLIKDGSEVDSAALLNAGETYVYKKKVGSISELPVIMVRFDTVFMGRETQMAILKGAFQISENYVKISSGDKYGVMKITEANENRISMKNDNSIDLSVGSTIDIMGNLKIMVADNSSVVRFALVTGKSDSVDYYDVRGTIYPVTDEWTPMNFGLNVGETNIGFYYDIDEGIGTERLKIKSMNTRTIPKNQLIYSTSPQEVSFDYSDFGRYQAIGFMADKYFAGYTEESVISNKERKSAIGSGQLHKILLDDEEKRTIYVGSTVTLKEGYVLKAKEIDIGVGTGQMWMTLLKDGNEIDDEVVATGGSYIYSKRVGNVDDIPLIAVHIDSVFRGREANAAFVKGIFQISESYTKIGAGNDYGLMEIAKVGQDEIVMENDDSIDLSSGSTIDLMGNMKLKVADSGTIRFYPFVRVTADMVANQLVIDAPTKATAGDAIRIKTIAGGNPIEGVSISINPEVGSIENVTGSDGYIEYTLPITLKGMYNITATKLGYEKTTKNIEILQYIEKRLSINVPTAADQFDTISIQTTSNNTVINGVAITYDNATIGTTNDKGILNYTLQSSGTHTMTASKNGYITVSTEISVRIPYSEFKAQDITLMPNKTRAKEKILITSNVTNVGTKADVLPVDLIVDETVVDSKPFELAPKETKEINFTYKVSVPEGNYTIEILEQTASLEVEKASLSLLLIGTIFTIIGAIVIYMVTGKDKILKIIGDLKTKIRK